MLAPSFILDDALAFDYATAFDRNIGWVTTAEQSVLRSRRVAIAGLGGVGGIHLLTLARLGIGAFTLADFDRFDIANLNRQAGATVETVGQPKLNVMAAKARTINPDVDLACFPDGVQSGSIEAFLSGADLFVDGLDFFALDIRRQVFARCAALGIPALTAAPIGMGVGFLAFVPGGMTFEDYFRFEGQTEQEQYLRFLVGLAPRFLHRTYLVDPSRVDLSARRGPSNVAACQLCAGVTAVAALKLLLHRGDVQPAPLHHHYDPYRGRLAVTRLRRGNAGPLQRLRLALARRMLLAARPRPEPDPPRSPIEAVLDIARWAPSGDNVQPWRFTPLSDHAAIVHLTGSPTIYEYRGGEPALLSAGMLLQTLRIGAAELGRALTWQVDGPDAVRVAVGEPGTVPRDRLFGHVTGRSVDRRPYRNRALTAREVQALEAAIGPGLAITWHTARSARWRIAGLGAEATAIRLRAAEGFKVHQGTIDWRRGDSASGIPSTAVGLDPATRVLMRWALRRWSRVRWLNRLTGTLALAAQMDYAPGLGCAAFFVVTAAPRDGAPDVRLQDTLQAGEALQRFWLTAASLGLSLQPALATLIFAHYGAHDLPFTVDPALRTRAVRLAASFTAVLGVHPDQAVFMGRIGEPRDRRRRPRSVRRALSELVVARPVATRPDAAGPEPAIAHHRP